jgi:N utilization substance protein B
MIVARIGESCPGKSSGPDYRVVVNKLSTLSLPRRPCGGGDAARASAYSARMSRTSARTKARAAARLAAVQALYQHDMESTAIPALLHEFHHHRLGATIEDVEYAEADILFFDDLVKGAAARLGEVDRLIEEKLTTSWTLARLDKPMKAILRAGTYELLARRDVPVGAVISEYVDVAHAFYEKRETGFVNGLLDAIAKDARAQG